MIKFTDYYKATKKQSLNEMTSDEAKILLKKAVEDADDKQLISMMKAVERPAISKKVSELFRKRGLSKYYKASPGKDFIDKIIWTKADVNDKVDFLNDLINGTYLDTGKFNKSKSGNIKDSFNTSNKIMGSLFPWLLQWKPEIDDVAVGPAEAVFIMAAEDGKKGAPAGDVYMGGKLIEVKVDGGAMGKAGSTHWGGQKDWFYSKVREMVPGFATLSKDEILKMGIPSGNHEAKSIAMNRLSMAMRLAGHDDNTIAKFWMDFVERATGSKIQASISVSRGVLNYDDYMRYLIGCGYETYKKKTGFDFVTLIQKVGGNYMNFFTGDDFFNDKTWSYDASLSWVGGGQGGSITPRIFLTGGAAKTIKSSMEAKLVDKQFKSIKAIGDLVLTINTTKTQKTVDRHKDKLKGLLKSLKVSPRIPHYVRMSSQANDKIKELMTLKSKKDIQSWVDKNLTK